MRRLSAITFSASLWLSVGLVVLVGCESEYPPRAAVSGTVTMNGQPVRQGTITYYPTEGRAAIGKIQPDGTYELTTFVRGDGAVLGEHRVTIQAIKVTGPTAPASFEEELRLREAPPPGGPTMVQWLVPAEFSDRTTSTLSAEVHSGPNRIDFQLPIVEGR